MNCAVCGFPRAKIFVKATNETLGIGVHKKRGRIVHAFDIE